MDPLDEVFAAMRIENALYARLEATAPWGLSTRRGDGTARFGLMVRGGCWLTLDDDAARQAPIALAAGDCFVIPRGLPYSLRDDLRSATVNCVDVVRANIGGVVPIGGGGAGTTVISGWFNFDPYPMVPGRYWTCCRRSCISAWTRTAHICCRPRSNCWRWRRHNGVSDPAWSSAAWRTSSSCRRFVPTSIRSTPKQRPDGSRRCRTAALGRRCIFCTKTLRRTGPWRRWPQQPGCHARGLRCASRKRSASRRSST